MSSWRVNHSIGIIQERLADYKNGKKIDLQSLFGDLEYVVRLLHPECDSEYEYAPAKRLGV